MNSTPPAPVVHRRRWLYVGIALLLLVLVYALAGFFGVPALLTSSLQKFTSTHYGRTLSLGDVRFNPFTLTLEVRDAALPGAHGEPPISFRRLRVQLEAASLWRRGASFAEILLEAPSVPILVRPDGSTNLGEFARPFASAPPAPGHPATSSAAQKPLRLFIDRLTLSSGSILYEDRSRPVPFRTELRALGFNLRQFSTVGTSADAFSLDARTELGERLHWNGSFALAPLSSHGTLRIDDLRASTLASYLGPALPARVVSGMLGLEAQYVFSLPESGVALQITLPALTLDRLAVAAAAGGDPPVQLGRLRVSGGHMDLAQRSLGVDHIELDGGTVRAWLDADGLSLSKLLAGGPSPAPAGATAKPWTITVPDIAVRNLELNAEDRRSSPVAQLTLSKVAVQVRGYRTPDAVPLQITASALVNGSSRLRANGQLDLDSKATKAHVELDAFDLRALQPYLAQRSALELTSGQLETRLDVEQGSDGRLGVRGDAHVRRLRTIDARLHRDFVHWEQLSVRGIKYQSQPARLSIRQILARAPYARVIIASDRSVNLAEAFSPAAASAAAPPTAAPASGSAPEQAAHSGAASSAASAPLAIAIGEVRIEDGSARYADLWIQPHFAVGIESLSGQITGLSSDPATRADVELSGAVDRYAPVRITGSINPLATSAFSDIKLSFKGLELTTLTPYSGRFAGYAIEKGKLSVDVSYHVENGQLQANPHFVIDQLQLGAPVASPDAIKLPLKLAIALLKDRNGVIDIGLPISGNLSDPQFRIAPLVWKAIVGLITKAATAPFAMLGHLFGGSAGEQLNVIAFAAGSARLDTQAQERLAALKHALTERPGLKLDVPAAYSPAQDTPALARAKLYAQLLPASAPTAGDTPAQSAPAPEPVIPQDPAQRLPLLLAAYHRTFGKKAPLPAPRAPASAATDAPTATAEAAGEKTVANAASAPGGSAPAPPAAAAPPANAAPTPDKAAGQADPAATADALEGALLQKITVNDSDLVRLGQRRARAVQDALLSGGQVDPARVFVINAPPRPASGERVNLELSLK